MKKQLLLVFVSVLGATAFGQTPRLSLYEEFTGETCPPCASTNPGLNALLAQPANTSNCVAIKWQVPIPSAPTKTWSLYQTNKTEIDWRAFSYGYGINSAPSGRMDGQNVTVFGASSDHPANLTSTIIATAQSYTSAFNITVSRAWTPGCTAVNLTVNIQATAGYTATGALRFRTVMVERLIQFSVQPGTNGETTFEDAAIRSFPNIQTGTTLTPTWTNGQSTTFTLNCPLPSYTRKKSEVAFVCFIQDDGNRKVAQAARVAKAAVPTDAIAALGASVNLTCNNSITPKISLRNDGVSAITNLTVTPYTDGVAGTPYAWSGNLAVGASTVITITGVNTSTTPGAHTFSFDVILPTPLYNLTNSLNNASYMVAASYQGSPVAEGFTTSAYPPAGWTMVNNDQGPSWTRNTSTGGFNFSSECTKYDFYSNTSIGDVDELYLPPMDLSGSGDPNMTMDIAYAQRTSASNDMLEVKASSDCGANWTTVFSQAGNNLTTIGPVANPAYVPDPFDASHWRTENITLTGFNKPNVIVKIVVTNDHGNNLYLDNINLSAFGATGIKKESINGNLLEVFPNPSADFANIRINTNTEGSGKLSIVNQLGQMVYEKSVSTHAGSSVIRVDVKNYTAGVYSVILDTNGKKDIQKLIIGK